MSGVPTRITNEHRRLDALELQLRALRRELAARPVRQSSLVPPDQVRLVQTFDNGSYPDGGSQTFPIRFCDADTSGPTFSARSAEQQSQATTFDARYVLPNKFCLASLLNGRWWITAGPGLWHIGRLNGTLTAGGETTMMVLDDNGTQLFDTGFDLTVHDFFSNDDEEPPEEDTKALALMLFPGSYYVIQIGCDVDSNDDSVYELSEELRMPMLLQLFARQAKRRQQRSVKPRHITRRRNR